MANASSIGSQVVEQVTLNYFSVAQNSNKVWIGRVYANGTYTYQNARVGAKLPDEKPKLMSSQGAALAYLRDKVYEKERSGYRVVNLAEGGMDDARGVLKTPLGAINADAVQTARGYLKSLKRVYDLSLVEAYYRLIPHSFGGKVPTDLLRSTAQIDREIALLDSINVALNKLTPQEEAFAAADAALAALREMYA